MIIVFEGIDGSGKGTQAKLLSTHFTSLDIKHALFSFPNYTGTSFGHEVGKYLNGAFGELNSLPPEFPAMLYALDRFEMKKQIDDALSKGMTVILDRYVPSNYAHQAAKLPELERMPFIDWVKRLEFNILGLPSPDVIFLLDVSPDITSNLILKKDKRTYTDEKKDIHERDTSYLSKVYDVYNMIATKEKWEIVHCAIQGEMRTIEDIADDVLSRLRKHLPKI